MDYIKIPKGEKKQPPNTFLGALVRYPITGLHDIVISIDVNSLYPFEVMKHNISFETVITFEELKDVANELYCRILEDIDIFNVCGDIETKYRNPFITDKSKKEKWRVMSMSEALKEFKKDYIKQHGIWDLVINDDYFNILKRKPEDFLYISILQSTIDKVFVNKLVNYSDLLKKYNLIMTPNLVFYNKKFWGIQAYLNRELYDIRKVQKANKRKYSKLFNDTKNKEYEDKLNFFSDNDVVAKNKLNAGFGANGNPNFKFFNINNATAITSCGQLYMKILGNDINTYINNQFDDKSDNNVGGDTDSIYIKLYKFFNHIAKTKNIDEFSNKDIIKYSLKIFNEGINPIVLKSFAETTDYLNAIHFTDFGVKLEKISKVAFFYKRKRYVLGVIWNEGVEYEHMKIKGTGFRIKSKNTPTIISKWLEEAIYIIFKKKPEELKKYIKQKRVEFEKLPLSTLAKSVTLSKYEKYIINTNDIPVSAFKDKRAFHGSNYYCNKGTPPHVKGSAYWNYLINKNNINTINCINNGDVIMMLDLKDGNWEKTICFNSDEILNNILDKRQIDYNKMWEVMFMNVIKMFTDTLGWDTKDNILDNISLLGF